MLLLYFFSSWGIPRFAVFYPDCCHGRSPNRKTFSRSRLLWRLFTSRCAYGFYPLRCCQRRMQNYEKYSWSWIFPLPAIDSFLYNLLQIICLFLVSNLLRRHHNSKILVKKKLFFGNFSCKLRVEESTTYFLLIFQKPRFRYWFSFLSRLDIYSAMRGMSWRDLFSSKLLWYL